MTSLPRNNSGCPEQQKTVCEKTPEESDDSQSLLIYSGISHIPGENNHHFEVGITPRDTEVCHRQSPSAYWFIGTFCTFLHILDKTGINEQNSPNPRPGAHVLPKLSLICH